MSYMYHMVLSIYHLLSDRRDLVVKLPTWVQTISEIKLLMLYLLELQKLITSLYLNEM